MEEHKQLKITISGIVYGKITSWFVVAGMVVGITGVMWYLLGDVHVMDFRPFMSQLWSGATAEEIWKEAAGERIRYGHWYLHCLSFSDAFALLGIGICCLGAVVGAWGTFVSMLCSSRGKDRGVYSIYLTLAFVIAVLLSLSALGLISMH